MSTLSLYPIFFSNNKMSNKVVVDPKCEDVVVSSSPSILSLSPSGRSVDSVRRCLFGRSDSRENQKFAREELLKISVADQSRWNFDFATDSPLPGKFDWEVVANPATALPEPYKPVASIGSMGPSARPLANRRALKIADISRANARRNLTFEPSVSQESQSEPTVLPIGAGEKIGEDKIVEDKVGEDKIGEDKIVEEQSIEGKASIEDNVSIVKRNSIEKRSSIEDRGSSDDISPIEVKGSIEENISNENNREETSCLNYSRNDLITSVSLVPSHMKPPKQTTMTDFMKICKKRRPEESKPSSVKKVKRGEETSA